MIHMILQYITSNITSIETLLINHYPQRADRDLVFSRGSTGSEHLSGADLGSPGPVGSLGCPGQEQKSDLFINGGYAWFVFFSYHKNHKS